MISSKQKNRSWLSLIKKSHTFWQYYSLSWQQEWFYLYSSKQVSSAAMLATCLNVTTFLRLAENPTRKFLMN